MCPASSNYATSYVARAFRAIGLEPAGDAGSFFQEFGFTAGVSLGEDPETAPYETILVSCEKGIVRLDGKVDRSQVKRRASEVAQTLAQTGAAGDELHPVTPADDRALESLLLALGHGLELAQGDAAQQATGGVVAEGAEGQHGAQRGSHEGEHQLGPEVHPPPPLPMLSGVQTARCIGGPL